MWFVNELFVGETKQGMSYKYDLGPCSTNDSHDSDCT